MDLAHFWKVLRRLWWLPVVVTLITTGGGFLISKAMRPVYQTSTDLLARTLGPGGTEDASASATAAQAYAVLVHSPFILQQAIHTLHLPLTPGSLDQKITVQVTFNTPLLEVTVQDTDPRRAATIANGFAQVLIAHVNDLQRHVTLARARAASTLQVAAPALVPIAPAQPNIQRNLVLALVVGFLIGLGLAMLVDLFDDRVRDPEEIQWPRGAAPLAALGVVRPTGARILVGSVAPGGPQFTSALLLLRANLAATLGNGPTAICISSAAPREGKSTVAANLAILEAQAGKRVVLIDANLRHPHLHQFFGVPNTRGLSMLLAQLGASVQPQLQHGPLNIKILPAGSFPLQDDAPTVQVLPAGWVPFTAAELLGSPRMVDLVALLRSQADVVIIDSAPICPTPETLLLQRAVDGTVLVMDVRRTGMKALGDAVSALQQVSGTMLGVVLNKSAPRTGSSGRGRLGTHQEHARSEDGITQPQVVLRTTGQPAPSAGERS